MAAQLRPTRLDVTDRFPMLGFTIRTTNPPRVAEVVLATSAALFASKEGRNPSNFYTSREHGLLTVAKGEAVYVVPPDVLGRFVAADRLYFGLATATPPKGDDWTVELRPAEDSPYVSLTGLSDRALRRVRMFPARRGSGRYAAGAPAAMLDWAGDRAEPGMAPAAPQAPAAAPGNGGAAPAAPPASVPYDDGFGPLPPLAGEPPAATPAAQSYSRGLGDDDDDKGIEGPVLDDEAFAPQAMALGGSSPVLTAAEYGGVTKLMPSPNYNNGRAGKAIDRIVIHITGAPQSPHLGSWFTNPASEASSQYMVDQNGQIIQFVREQDTAWHSGKRSMNRRSIGIEHVAVQQGGARYKKKDGTYKTYPYTPPTDIEYRTSAALVAHLCIKYGLTPDRTTIIGHREANPGTGHSVCPDGAWDWDAYMALVAAEHAALTAAAPGTGTGTGQGLGYARGLEVDPEAMGIEGPAYSGEGAEPAAQASALALAAKEYDRVSRVAISPAFTTGRSGKAINRIVIHITDAPTTASTVNHFTRKEANTSAHYLVGQDGEIVQFVSEADTAWHAKGQNSNSIGIEHVAVKKGGATYGKTTFPYMPPTDIQYDESAALVCHLCDKYGLTPDRTTIIGHREADPKTPHATCPDGAWDWEHFMHLVTNRVCEPQPAGQGLSATSRAMSGDGDTVEIKYRAFIPSPAIKGPLIDNYHGDGRGFSYSGGTSRGEIICLVDVSPSGAISNLRTKAHWSPTYSYSSDDTPSVPGKPDWWLGLNSGAAHKGQGDCDGELRASFGAPGSTRNITAGIEQASIVSLYMSGNNPLATGSPAIDADVSVFLRRSGDGGVEARAVGSHDGFPAHELYVNGKRLHAYDPVAAGKGPTALLPPADIDLDTSWTAVSTATASAQSYDVGARALGGSGGTLVFKDRPSGEDWHCVDFKHVPLTEVSWSSAPDKPVAFIFFGHPNIDFDGSPTAYHPDGGGDDNLGNAGNEANGWFGVASLSPTDKAVREGKAVIDERPERKLKDAYPVIQQERFGDPKPGYYVSRSAIPADPDLPEYRQKHHTDASTIAYGALSGKLKGLGMALGDYGLAIRHNDDLQSGFYFADSGGKNSYALGEVSHKVGKNLGGTRRGNYFVNDFPISFLVFPGTSTRSKGDPPLSDADINAKVAAIMADLCQAANAQELALLLALNEVAPGTRPPGKAGLEVYLKKPGNPPRNYGTVVAGLRKFNFNVPDAPAQGQSYQAQGLAGEDWSVNWDEVHSIAQPTGMSCWATAAAMLIGWRERQSVSPTLLAETNGLLGSLTGGLLPEDKKAFADALDLKVHPNACYTPEGFRDILVANGPIWVTAKVPGVHAIVVTGMYCENGNYFVRVTDPWDRIVGLPGAPGPRPTTHKTGSQYIMTYDAFTSEFEAAGDIDRIQLLHTGGTHGHIVNRGSAKTAGYALGMGDASGGPDFGPGTSLTRQVSEEAGRRYDLAQLSGMVAPANALAGGAGAPALPGERAVLTDWPYIDGPSGRTQAGVSIDWQVQGGAVGNVVIAAAGGQMLDGWAAAVRADIARSASTPERVNLLVRVTTTFSRANEKDQVAVSEVLLCGDGRAQKRHGADQAATAPPAPAAEPARQAVPA